MRKLGLNGLWALVPFAAEGHFSRIFFKNRRYYFHSLILTAIFLGGGFYLRWSRAGTMAGLTAFLFIHISYMCRGYDRLMSFYGEREDSMDVVFVGTSVTFSAIAPMDLWDAFGIPACVYATNMQFENAMTYSVREVMKTQSPKLLMVDIAPFVAGCHPASEEWDETNRALFTKFNLDSMKYSFGRTALTWECVRAQGGDLYDFLYYLFDIGRYHTDGMKKRQWDNAFYDVNHGFQYLSRNSTVSKSSASSFSGAIVLRLYSQLSVGTDTHFVT